MRTYTKVLATRHAKHLITSNLVGRLPNGMGVLAIVLFLRANGVSYQWIGALSAAYALASAIGGPALGRIVDRRGQAMVLIVAALGSSAGFVVLAAAGTDNLGVTAAAVVVAGLLTPPLEPCLRSLWPDLLSDKDTLVGAYALDAALQEVIFVAGPLLATAAIAVVNPAGALWTTALTATIGTLVFVAAPPVRAWRAQPRKPDWAGPLRSAPVRILLLALLFVGTAVGVLAIAATAYAEHAHQPDLSGYLLGANAGGALIGGLVYGVRTWPGTSRGQIRWLLAALAVCYWPLAIVAAPPVTLILALVSGVFLAPLLACCFVVIGAVAPQGTVTEAFAWVVTIFMAGTSLGSAAAGVAVQHGGLTTAFLLPGLAGTVAAVPIFRSAYFRPSRPATDDPNSPAGSGPEPVSGLAVDSVLAEGESDSRIDAV